MKKCSLILLAISCWFAVPATWAVLDLELTHGSKIAVPLGVASLTGSASEADKKALMQVIEQDLQNSGWFHLIAPPADGGLMVWRGAGANALLSGQMQSVGNGRIQVNMRLRGLYGGAELGESLWAVSYRFKKSGLRQLAHRISDQVFEKLTGVPGNFSTKLAYVTVDYPKHGYVSYRLIVADADGYSPQVLLRSSSPIMSPTWSPDGKGLAYVSFEHHQAQIYWQNLATGKRHRISAAPGINSAPSFSPDGRHMAVVLSKTGNPKIYDLTLATGQLKQLTHGWSIDTEPAWSPDGQQILFTSNRGGTPQIYAYHLKSHVVARLTYDGSYNARPRWLPSGAGFVLMHRDRRGGFSIAKKNFGDDGLLVLTPAGKNESPSVAPNGQMIVFASGPELAQVSTDADVTLLLPSTAGVVENPAWSPFLG